MEAESGIHETAHNTKGMGNIMNILNEEAVFR